MKNKIKKTFVGALLAIMLMPTMVFANSEKNKDIQPTMFFQIVFHNPAVLVTNDHRNSFNYKGYMRIKTNVVVARHIYTDGWIRYYIPGGRDTGRVYTKKTGTELREARVTFRDSLNPIAKKQGSDMIVILNM